jgi:hypothetical protein
LIVRRWWIGLLTKLGLTHQGRLHNSHAQSSRRCVRSSEAKKEAAGPQNRTKIDRVVTVDLEALTKILQASISPVALISGVGLLILSLTNRFGRVTDRTREMADRAPGDYRENQLRIFQRRAALLRSSITCAVGSVLIASVLVLVLFAAAIARINLQLLIFALFSCSLLLLIACLILFLRDMHLSLHAVDEHLRAKKAPPAV